jgi:hypothetical protein
MKVGIGTVATQFLFWEYLFRIFGIVSLQCRLGKTLKTDRKTVKKLGPDKKTLKIQDLEYKTGPVTMKTGKKTIFKTLNAKEDQIR